MKVLQMQCIGGPCDLANAYEMPGLRCACLKALLGCSCEVLV